MTLTNTNLYVPLSGIQGSSGLWGARIWIPTVGSHAKKHGLRVLDFCFRASSYNTQHPKYWILTFKLSCPKPEAPKHLPACLLTVVLESLRSANAGFKTCTYSETPKPHSEAIYQFSLNHHPPAVYVLFLAQGILGSLLFVQGVFKAQALYNAQGFLDL